MHLLSLVADRLWLVQDGRVTPYDGDLEAYRSLLLASNKTGDKPAKSEKPATAKPKRPSRDVVLALRAEVRKCEERVAKITEMHEKLSEKLADPALYEDDRRDDLTLWNKKFAEGEEGLEKAEALWMEALEKLEAAEG
jgi:ATP-binding cassette subfamily F protein 3